MVANIQEKSVHLYKIPASEHTAIREAFDQGEWFWLVKKWNDYQVTTTKLCPACPDSITVVKHYLPGLWS